MVTSIHDDLLAPDVIANPSGPGDVASPGGAVAKPDIGNGNVGICPHAQHSCPPASAVSLGWMKEESDDGQAIRPGNRALPD